MAREWQEQVKSKGVSIMTNTIVYVAAYILIGVFSGLASKSFGERRDLHGVGAPVAWGLVGSVAFGAASLALLHGGPDRDLVYKEGWDTGTTLPAYWVSLFISLAGAMLALTLHRLLAGKESRLE
jgi:uncharacterized membrane protein YeaQ/YmgE (transglycosylase-associated protein family)